MAGNPSENPKIFHHRSETGAQQLIVVDLATGQQVVVKGPVLEAVREAAEGDVFHAYAAREDLPLPDSTIPVYSARPRRRNGKKGKKGQQGDGYETKPNADDKNPEELSYGYQEMLQDKGPEAEDNGARRYFRKIHGNSEE